MTNTRLSRDRPFRAPDTYKDLKIYVNEIPPGGMDIEGNIAVSDLNLETEHIHYKNAPTVKAHIERDKDIVRVNCRINGLRRYTCSRCLKEFDSPLQKDVDFIYELRGEYVIKLDDNIRDEIILDYPIRLLCRADCRGICPRCGKDLNEGPCGCK